MYSQLQHRPYSHSHSSARRGSNDVAKDIVFPALETKCLGETNDSSFRRGILRGE